MRNMNLPNRLTILRMLLVPVFVLTCTFEAWLSWWNILAAVMFSLAALTDIVDGQIARSRGLVTNFGKLMDPIADKLLYCAAFIMLTWMHRLSPLLCILFLGREFVISGFRLVTSSSGAVIAASRLGKAKTLTQAIAIVAMLVQDPSMTGWIAVFASIMMYAAAVLSVWSAADYIFKNRKAVSWE